MIIRKRTANNCRSRSDGFAICLRRVEGFVIPYRSPVLMLRITNPQIHCSWISNPAERRP